jgi:hypothetical protein
LYPLSTAPFMVRLSQHIRTCPWKALCGLASRTRRGARMSDRFHGRLSENHLRKVFFPISSLSTAPFETTTKLASTFGSTVCFAPNLCQRIRTRFQQPPLSVACVRVDLPSAVLSSSSRTICKPLENMDSCSPICSAARGAQ